MKTRLVFGAIALAACSAFWSACDREKVSQLDTADGANGGVLFDNFWAVESDFDQSDTSKIKAFNLKADFFRCKQCHGWDLKGTEGSYISRKPNKNRPNVSPVNLRELTQIRTDIELFDAIKGSIAYPRRNWASDLSDYDPAANAALGDRMPDFGGILSDGQIWDLVKFLKESSLDVDELYDSQTTGNYPTGTIKYSNLGRGADIVAGKAIFTKNCLQCHGVDGKEILLENGTQSLGAFSRAKPYEVQHKVKFGQLGSLMNGAPLTDDEMRQLYRALGDLGLFPD